MPGASDVYAQLKNVVDTVEALERTVNRIVAAVATLSNAADSNLLTAQLRTNLAPLPSLAAAANNL
jgi:hypothetical protein